MTQIITQGEVSATKRRIILEVAIVCTKEIPDGVMFKFEGREFVLPFADFEMWYLENAKVRIDCEPPTYRETL